MICPLRRRARRAKPPGEDTSTPSVESQPGAGAGDPGEDSRPGGDLALRTRRGVKPVYVSMGHLIDLSGAARIVLSCCRGYRHPEPLREAHRWVTELARQLGAAFTPAEAGGDGPC
jgi:hypothetical protein